MLGYFNDFAKVRNRNTVFPFLNRLLGNIKKCGKLFLE